MEGVKSIGIVAVDLKEDDRVWGRIESDGENLIVGMYEDGVIKRKLFYMSTKQSAQLGNVLLMLSKAMEES